MPKLNIKVTVKSSEEDTNYEVPAIIQDEIIKYKEPNGTTVIYDYDKKSLFRENDELRMTYYFNNAEEGIINVKEFNKEINIDIKTNKLERKNNNIEVEFIIENNTFLYKIEEIKWVY